MIVFFVRLASGAVRTSYIGAARVFEVLALGAKFLGLGYLDGGEQLRALSCAADQPALPPLFEVWQLRLRAPRLRGGDPFQMTVCGEVGEELSEAYWE